jgi:tRNA G10  N-methylase Trm11
MPTTYFFLLGRTPELSLRELSALSGQTPEIILVDKIASLSFEDEGVATRFFDSLGGSLKLMQLEGQFSDLTEEELLERMIAYFAQFDRPTLAVAEFGRENIQKIDPSDIKKALKSQNVSSRFIEAPREGLSASVLIHQKNVTELNVIKAGTAVFFAKTLAAQNIDDWTVRDREKPYADRKKGMLPPKVARMMVNLALGNLEGAEKKSIYDPFCGSGTVLLEAAMRECHVAGSDVDENAVQGTKENLEWFKGAYDKLDLQSTVFKADVAGVKPEQIGQQIDAIVTEPFLGRPTPKVEDLPNIFKGLEKMYIGAFRQWTKILKNNSVVIIVFPFVQAGKRSFSLEGMIDKLQQLGYTPLSEPVFYHRPQAVIQRQIWTFKLNK